MASEAFVNGSYTQNNGYAADQQQHANYSGQQSYSQTSSTTANAGASVANSQNSDIPKDEVGWYFVEQYYTTLSKNPDRLYLYYNKRSQFVSGNETDKVQVCVGQRAINDRIKELDFQDCKVRITNVDSQASDQNIVIQVIGEISNKSQPHRKFTQTFVLATQTNGYFVLNDIFRYIIEEEDDTPEPPTDSAATVEAAPSSETKPPKPAAHIAIPEHTTLTSSNDPAAIEHDAEELDEEIEEKLVNGGEEENNNNVVESTELDGLESEAPERPHEPEHTPVATPPLSSKQAPVQPAAAPKPSGPKTWASMAASANKSTGAAKPPVPAIPGQRSTPATKSGTTQASATTSSQAAQPESTAASATPAGPRDDTAGAATTASTPTSGASGAVDSQDEWTAVGSSHTRQQSRQVNGAQQDGPQRRGYIKNVREHVSGPELRNALEKFGKISYFDISQQKNCAFVDFETPEGYQAAVAGNPHVLGNDAFTVEERKLRPGSTPYVPRGQHQGNRGGRSGVAQ